jgi:hypothetical protein
MGGSVGGHDRVRRPIGIRRSAQIVKSLWSWESTACNVRQERKELSALP